jgi:anti-sigma factor RsiW
MNCEKYKEIISAFVDSEASPLEQLALQKHLEVCGACKTELMLQYKIKNMIVSESGEGSDISISSSIMAKVRAIPSKPRGFAAGSLAAAPVSRFAAAAVILAAMVATMLYVYTARVDMAAIEDSGQYTSYVYSHVNEDAEAEDTGRGSGRDYIAVPDRRISTVSLSR